MKLNCETYPLRVRDVFGSVEELSRYDARFHLTSELSCSSVEELWSLNLVVLAEGAGAQFFATH